MKILVIGSGGREHALAWKLAQSPLVTEIVCAPGNGGTSTERKCRNVEISAENIPSLIELAQKERFDLTVVGPEKPLVDGIVEKWPKDLLIWGPNKFSAELEGYKIRAKHWMRYVGIPTADWMDFTEQSQALSWIELQEDKPRVVKADGLAAGKGVFVCKNKEEIIQAIEKMSQFGDRFLIEDCLVGKEVSFFALCGKNGQVIPLQSAQDYKRAYNGDLGPNTGGMGAYSPANHLTKKQEKFVVEKIIRPIMKLTSYTGFIYVGLMLTEDGPMVLEFNVRMGDPETQVILPRLKNDLAEMLYTMADEKTYSQKLVWTKEAAVTVAMTLQNYPDKSPTGDLIIGLEQIPKIAPDAIVFHAGTKLEKDHFLTDGNRVLYVTSLEPTINQARKIAYQAVEKINWTGARYRTDIGLNIA